MIDYSEMNKDFYKDVASSKNPIRSWFHNSRHLLTKKLVDKYYKDGMVIADLGCGNVLWNTDLLPVTGVDVNEDFLNFNLKNKTINKKIISPLKKITMDDETCDIIIITEILEHLENLDDHINEIKRILKPKGKIICSVPYDTFFSLWKPLFFIQCFYRGQILNEDYYKEQCGHINNFSKKTIANLLKNNELNILEQTHNFYLTIFTVAQK